MQTTRRITSALTIFLLALCLGGMALGADSPEVVFWRSVKTSDVIEEYRLYVEQYPNGQYVGDAWRRIGQIEAQTAAKKQAEESSRRENGPRLREEDGVIRKEERRQEEATAVRETLLETDKPRKKRAKKRDSQTTFEADAAVRPDTNTMRSGTVFKDCSDCPDMVVIPEGTFEMGSNSGNGDEKPVHTVRIGNAFALGKTEVTQGQWRAILGSNPSHFSACGDDCPVEKVNWNEAQEYVRKLSKKVGKTYRLPSEAEWEYACRAGGTNVHCGSDSVDSVAWYSNNSGGKTHTVAAKQANGWGLFDMSGNVWEWTEDCRYDRYYGAPGEGHNFDFAYKDREQPIGYVGAPSGGSAWATGACEARVIRGGSYLNDTKATSATGRKGSIAKDSGSALGFRPARTLP